MVPHTSCNGADHTPFPGTSRGAAPGVTARQFHNAGPRGRHMPHAARQARTRHPSTRHDGSSERPAGMACWPIDAIPNRLYGADREAGTPLLLSPAERCFG